MKSGHKYKETKSISKSINEKSKIYHMIICTTGFYPEEEQKIINILELEEAYYKEDLPKNASYLISNKANTDKTKEASKQGIIIVTRGWIEDKENFLDTEKYKMKCFYNIVFSLVGFDSNQTEEIKKKIEYYDGKLDGSKTSYEDSDVIIIKSGLILSKSENDEFMKYKFKTYSEKWFKDCIIKNKFLEKDKKYEFNNDIIMLKFEEVKSENKNFSEKNELFNCLFLDKLFYISEAFDKNSYNCLKYLISIYGGLIYNTITPLTNYIICITKNDLKNEPYVQNYNEYSENFKPIILTYDFIFESINNKKIQNAENFKPIDTSLIFLNPNNSNNNKYIKKAIISTIFKNETFTICRKTYNEKQYEEICEKIIENSGTLFESTSNIFKDNLGKYVICNDGKPDFISALIKYKNNDINHNKDIVIVSHRFIDICIVEKKIINMSGYLNLFPFNFNVPVEKFKNLIFFIPPNYYKFLEYQRIELLIETLGGIVNHLDKNTTHFIVNMPIKQKDYDKCKSINDKIKIVKEEWLIDFFMGTGELPNEKNYFPDIKP